MILVNNSDFSQHFSLCDTVFQDATQADEYSLSVIDVLVLTQLVYEQDNFNLTTMVELYFNDSYKIVNQSDKEPVWFHMRPNIDYSYSNETTSDEDEVNVDFIVVRGTSSPLDALQDISIFLEIVTLQILSWVFPFLNALPDSFTRSIVYYSSLPEGVINGEAISDFSKEIYEYATDVLTEYESNGRTTNLFIVYVFFFLGFCCLLFFVLLFFAT